MKQITINCALDGSSTWIDKGSSILLSNENNATEVTINFPPEYTTYTKMMDIFMGFDDTGATVPEVIKRTTGDTLTFILTNAHTKKGYIDIQPIATLAVMGQTVDDTVKWRIVGNVQIKNSLDITEDSTVPSVVTSLENYIDVLATAQDLVIAEAITDLNASMEIKDVTAETIEPDLPATAEVLKAADGLTFNFKFSRGFRGFSGEINHITIGTITSLPVGSTATAELTGESPNQVLNLGIPIGATGAPGPSNALTVGTVTTLPVGSQATITITGESPNQIINIGLPIGATGAKGAQWRGAYSAETAYVVDNLVSYNGNTYICILGSTGNLPSVTTYWSLFAQAGEVTAAQLATKADKLMATNLVTNSSFESDMTGWTVMAGTVVASTEQKLGGAKSAKFTAIGSGASVRIADNSIIGHTYYAVINYYLLSYVSGQIFIQVGGFPSYPTDFGLNAWKRFSKNVVSIATNHGIYAGALSGTMVGYMDNLFTLDLTAIFGAGKEPTAAQMDALLANFPNSWFDGTVELASLINILNTKADKAQEAWIYPTLVNSWVEYSAATKIRYYKDSMGIVHLDGTIKSGTADLICILPAGYRPASAQYLPTFDNYVFSSTSISTNGAISRMTGAKVMLSFAGITFRAEQ